jgi:quercetin dioxygenase-like cupin family protein
MTSELTTLERAATMPSAKTILSQDDFNCSIVPLRPGDEIAHQKPAPGEVRILFVIDGQITVRADLINTVLGKDEALIMPDDDVHLNSANPDAWAKLLIVKVPPRQVITPQIISFDHR